MRTATKRPELGELTVGQPVMIHRSPNDMRGRDITEAWIPAVVVTASRVWVQLKRADNADYGWKQWRMRRDTQNEGTKYTGSNASFATREQYDWDQTRAWALRRLGENGIRLDRDSPWYGNEVALADIIVRDAQEQEGE